MAGRILKTGLSGFAGAIIDVIVLIILVELAGMQVGWAAFAAAASGAGVTFVLSKFWAFRDRTPVKVKQVGVYAFVSLVTAICMAVSVHVLAIVLGLAYLIAKGIASVVVFLCWSYPAQARLVFARASAVRASSTHRIVSSRGAPGAIV